MSAGEAYPSEFAIGKLAKLLNLGTKEMQKLAVQDWFEHKFGPTASVVGGRDPESAPVTKRWRKLTSEQQKMVLAMMDGFATQNEQAAPRKRKA